MSTFEFDARAHFSELELHILKLFYLREPARELRKIDPFIDPWELVRRHRHLPAEGYRAVKWELIKLNRLSLRPKPVVERKNYWRQERLQCPYCRGWYEGHNWQAAHNGSNMIGFRLSGCRFCYEEKLHRYQDSRG